MPGYKGWGPIRSCANLVSRLKDDFDFFIVTRNADLGEKEPYPEVMSNQWNVIAGNVKIFYAPESRLTYKNVKSILLKHPYDFIYLNSLFSYRFTLLPLLVNRLSGIGKRVILAPRGMLGKGALDIKPLKKRTFIFLANAAGLFKNVIWHATSGDEKNDILKHFGSRTSIKVAANLPSATASRHVIREKIPGRLDMVFLSRISPKKNLAAVFDYLAGLTAEGRINFDIYGPLEDVSYWNLCRDKGKKLPEGITFSHKGVIPHESVPDVFSRYHCFIFPTFHENYGHVILEALSAGCPVIVSDNTIWKNMETNHAGWDIPLSMPGKFIEALHRLLAMGQDEFNSWSLGAYNMALSYINDNKPVAQTRELFA